MIFGQNAVVSVNKSCMTLAECAGAQSCHRILDPGYEFCPQDVHIVDCGEPVLCLEPGQGLQIPDETTKPEDFTLAGCFVVITVRIASSASPKARYQSFLLFLTGSTVQVFSSLTMMTQWAGSLFNLLRRASHHCKWSWRNFGVSRGRCNNTKLKRKHQQIQEKVGNSKSDIYSTQESN